VGKIGATQVSSCRRAGVTGIWLLCRLVVRHRIHTCSMAAARRPISSVRHVIMAHFWTALFTAKTWKEWLVASSNLEAGFPEGARNALAKVSLGDVLLCYVSSPTSSFVGAFRVKGSLREGGKGIWSGDEYPLRFPIDVEVALTLDRAIPYRRFDFLPTMSSNHGTQVPSRGQIGGTARRFAPGHGERVFSALLSISHGRTPTCPSLIDFPEPDWDEQLDWSSGEFH